MTRKSMWAPLGRVALAGVLAAGLALPGGIAFGDGLGVQDPPPRP